MSRAAYAYAAALYCEPCGEALKARLEPAEDSGDYPQGPYGEGAGEADSPQHCAACNAFLDNPLTREGAAYVCERLAPVLASIDESLWTKDGFADFVASACEAQAKPVLAEWVRAYRYLLEPRPDLE